MIAYYKGMSAIQTSQSNRSTCEHCGCTPDDHYSRGEYARHAGARYTQGRRNRTRLDWVPERCLAQYGAWVGLRLCHTCYEQVMAEINRPGRGKEQA